MPTYRINGNYYWMEPYKPEPWPFVTPQDEHCRRCGRSADDMIAIRREWFDKRYGNPSFWERLRRKFGGSEPTFDPHKLENWFSPDETAFYTVPENVPSEYAKKVVCGECSIYIYNHTPGFDGDKRFTVEVVWTDDVHLPLDEDW